MVETSYLAVIDDITRQSDPKDRHTNTKQQHGTQYDYLSEGETEKQGC